MSTGQGLLGNNMFAYCLNNPIRRIDSGGALTQELFEPDGNIVPDEDEFGGNGKSSSGGQANGSAGSGSNSLTPVFPTDAGGGKTGTSPAPKQGAPGSVYTQVSSDGNVVSQTLYNEYNMPAMRIDYSGHNHGTIIGPHIHFFSVYVGPNGIFLNKGPIVQCVFF